MKNTLLVFLVCLMAFLVPSVTFAIECPAGAPQRFTDVICIFVDLATIATPIVAGLALWLFFASLQNFILGAGNEEARAAGKKTLLWGIISIFVIVSIWGIIIFLSNDIFGPPPVSGIPLLPSGR